MTIMKKSANMEYIEDCIGELDFDSVKNSNNTKLLSTIQRFLDREFGAISKCKSIEICSNGSSEFYGMRVFPTDSVIQNISGSLDSSDEAFKKNATKVTEYTIEIDSKIGSKLIGLREDEITAILLHEIGHLVLDNKIIEDIQMSYLEAKANVFNIESNEGTRALELLYCMSQLQKAQLVNSVKNMTMEQNADKFAVSQGYGLELNRALSKIANFFKKDAKRCVKSNKELTEEMRQEAKMFTDFAKSFENRRTTVNDIIKAEYSKTLFGREKLLLTKALNTINGFKPKRKRNLIMNESLLHLRPKFGRKDLDTLSVEMEMVKDYDDKLYLVRKIHKQISKIDDYVSKEKDDNKQQLYSGYRKQLYDMLNSLISKKIVEKKYGVFVKYPKGYEG